MVKYKLTYTANPPINTNTYCTLQVIRITRKNQSPTALLSVYDVFVQKMTSSIPTELERYLTKRGYKNNFVKSQISRAKSIPRNDTSVKENSPEIKKPDRVPFITTYNPALPNIHKVLRQKQPILHSTERLHEIFKETPVVAYRRSPNLPGLLVRAKLKNPSTASQPNHSFGTFRCNSKHGCLTCPHIDNERTNYTFNKHLRSARNQTANDV